MGVRARHVSRYLLGFLTLSILLSASAGTQPSQGAGKQPPLPQGSSIIFVELGSIKCIPCRMMQPVMRNIEAKYGAQIKVIFYDVWKSENRKYAEEYRVRVIPTQVFLDKGGKEIFRHEGFFPESEIDALLAKHGLKILS